MQAAALKMSSLDLVLPKRTARSPGLLHILTQGHIEGVIRDLISQAPFGGCILFFSSGNIKVCNEVCFN